jgi:F-type H+-transporting ATPase subunit b
MLALALQATADSGGQIQEIARTFGVDWPHLVAQIVSFTIVCAILYALAYKPILGMLHARRQQIASGLANAEKIKAELARTETDRRDVLAKADARGRQLIDEARAAARRVEDEQTRKATAAADQIVARARQEIEHDRARLLAEVKRDIGRLVVRATTAVAGRVLTADDHRRLVEETAKQLKADNDNNQKGATRGSPAPAGVLRR